VLGVLWRPYPIVEAHRTAQMVEGATPPRDPREPGGQPATGLAIHAQGSSSSRVILPP
jgi:hypothetical protein